jgi:hypothetical protein
MGREKGLACIEEEAAAACKQGDEGGLSVEDVVDHRVKLGVHLRIRWAVARRKRSGGLGAWREAHVTERHAHCGACALRACALWPSSHREGGGDEGLDIRDRVHRAATTNVATEAG